MPEPLDQKTINDDLRQWHYWWLVVFSLLLIITFVYYLPLRFLHQASQDTEHYADTHVLPVYKKKKLKKKKVFMGGSFYTPQFGADGRRSYAQFFCKSKAGRNPRA